MWKALVFHQQQEHGLNLSITMNDTWYSISNLYLSVPKITATRAGSCQTPITISSQYLKLSATSVTISLLSGTSYRLGRFTIFEVTTNLLSNVTRSSEKTDLAENSCTWYQTRCSWLTSIIDKASRWWRGWWRSKPVAIYMKIDYFTCTRILTTTSILAAVVPKSRLTKSRATMMRFSMTKTQEDSASLQKTNDDCIIGGRVDSKA